MQIDTRYAKALVEAIEFAKETDGILSEFGVDPTRYGHIKYAIDYPDVPTVITGDYSIVMNRLFPLTFILHCKLWKVADEFKNRDFCKEEVIPATKEEVDVDFVAAFMDILSAEKYLELTLQDFSVSEEEKTITIKMYDAKHKRTINKEFSYDKYTATYSRSIYLALRAVKEKFYLYGVLHEEFANALYHRGTGRERKNNSGWVT